MKDGGRPKEHKMENVTILAEQTYETPLQGYTKMWGEPVVITGEQTVRLEDEDRVIECYIYNFPHNPAANGKPYIALKANIAVQGE